MSDGYPAFIKIGGRLSSHLIRHFVEACINSGAYIYDDKEVPATIRTPEELMALVDSDGYIVLGNSEAHSGQFHVLEAFLSANEMSFDRHSDGYCGTDAEWLLCRGPKTVCCASNESADFLLNAILTRKAYQVLLDGDVHSALEYLERAVGEFSRVPELPKFEIVAYPSGEGKSHGKSEKGGVRRRRS